MKNLNPVWNESYTFDLTNNSDVLTFTVMDYDYLTADDPMGNIAILINTLPKNQPQTMNLPLSNCKRGSLNVEVSLLDVIPPGMQTYTPTPINQPTQSNWQRSLEQQLQNMRNQIVQMHQKVDVTLRNVNSSAKEDLRKALKTLVTQINTLECYSKKLIVLSDKFLENPVEVQKTLQEILFVARTIVQVLTVLNNIAAFVFPFTPLAPLTPLLVTANGILRTVQSLMNNVTAEQVAITAIEISRMAVTLHNCFNELLGVIQGVSQPVMRMNTSGDVIYPINYQ